jgi:hypothetical protein
MSSFELPTPPKIEERTWAERQHVESEVPFPVVANYPDVCGFLPPGARRRAINVIHLMAHTLNLELCTPGLGVLLLDRFFSTRKTLPSSPDSVVLTAMICLNVAGKVADVDRGFCGSKGVIDMIRDASPFKLRQGNRAMFSKYVAVLEREILYTLDSTLLSCPCAMQTISELTGWNLLNEPLWLRSAFVCDVFGVDSASTYFSQTQIARAVVGVVTLSPEMHAATAAILRGLKVFCASALEKDYRRDPYFGVRMRHSTNSEAILLCSELGKG